MAVKFMNKLSLLATSLLAGMCLANAASAQSSQNFQMRLDYAVTYTPYHPLGQIDFSPPFTLCRNNAIALRFRYTWLNPFQEYVYTEPFTALFPHYYMQGVSPNPAFMPAAQPGNPVLRGVDVGLIAGSVNTQGSRQVTFRGRTSGFFGSPIAYATSTVLIETQVEPQPTQYAEIADGEIDMPTRPWFRWAASIADNNRLDVGACSNADAATPEECGASAMTGIPLDALCGPAAYCWVGTTNTHQMATNLLPNKAYQYRVLGRNNCGVSSEFNSTPPRPFFKTAQACFTTGGSIPDGGIVHFDVATSNPPPCISGCLARDLRVTVHTDHADVSDLRISLTKTSPVAAGPLLLMDGPTGTNCVNGKRLQAAFADDGATASAGCSSTEPAINGRVRPVQALSSFAPLEGTGTWRLTVEDTNADGKTGNLIEWCLSSENALAAAALPAPAVMANGFEDGGN